MARRGVPATALVTEEFWAQGDFVAMSAGMPTIPRVRLPHPVAGTGDAAMRKIAAEVAATIAAGLEGVSC